MARAKKQGARKSAPAVAEPAEEEETPSAAELDATPAPTLADEPVVQIWDEATPPQGTHVAPPSTPPIPAAQAKADLEAQRERSDRSRIRRLERAGFDADRCAVLDVELDVPLDLGLPGARAVTPTRLGDLVISELAYALVTSGATPEQLELAAAWLRGRRG